MKLGTMETLRHRAMPRQQEREGKIVLLEPTPLREGGSSGSSHVFFFDNKLEPWLRGNMERKSTVER
jgi:hypothetical protein